MNAKLHGRTANLHKDHADRLDGTAYVNAYKTAQDFANQGVVIDDDRLRDDDGNLIPPSAGTRWGTRMGFLRKAAREGVWTLPGPDITDLDLSEVAKVLAESDELDVRNGRTREQLYARSEALKETLTQIECYVPDRVIPHQYERLNLPSKGVFWAGDLSVIAAPLYMSGVPLPLAMLQGGAVALTAVMVGSWLGADGGAHLRRIRRGPIPEKVSNGLADLFQGQQASMAFPIRLITLAVVGISLALFTAIMLVVLGQGEPALHAAGAGLMTGLTVWGSAAAQHLTSNSAATLTKATATELQEVHERIAELDAPGVTAAGAQATYDEHLALVEAAAEAADAVVAALDPRVDTPRVNGYDVVKPPAPRASSSAPHTGSQDQTEGPPVPRMAEETSTWLWRNVMPNGKTASDTTA